MGFYLEILFWFVFFEVRLGCSWSLMVEYCLLSVFLLFIFVFGEVCVGRLGLGVR